MMRSFLAGFYLDAAPPATHRIVVRLGAVGSALSAILLVAIGAARSDPHLLYEAIGPCIGSVIFSMHILAKREFATAALLEVALVRVVTFLVWGTSATVLAALFGVWLFALAGAFFVVKRPALYLSTTSVGILCVPLLWGDSLDSPVATALTMFVAYLITVVLLLLIRHTSAMSDRRFERLFNSAPVALMEQDMSEALEFVRATGIRDALQLGVAMEDMDFLRAVVSRVRVVRANAKAIRLSGVPGQELIGYIPVDRVHDDSADAFRAQLLAAWSGRPRLDVEYRTTQFTGDGPVWLRVEIMSMELSPHAERVLLAVTDVTADKTSEAELKDLVRAKDEFIASVSHELRTPLTGVLGLTAALVEGRVSDPSEQKELLEMVMTQSQEISYLVEDLLVGARADIGTIAIRSEVIDLQSEVQDVLASLGQPGALIDCRSDAAALADSVRVRQIMRNLVVNAERYGGPTMKAIVRRSGDRTLFEMWDDGPVIPEEAQERIFEPYGRAHQVAGTTASVGLGLAVSRQLAELMGGTLEYLYDAGSVFRLSLPSADHRSAEVLVMSSPQFSGAVE